MTTQELVAAAYGVQMESELLAGKRISGVMACFLYMSFLARGVDRKIDQAWDGRVTVQTVGLDRSDQFVAIDGEVTRVRRASNGIAFSSEKPGVREQGDSFFS